MQTRLTLLLAVGLVAAGTLAVWQARSAASSAATAVTFTKLWTARVPPIADSVPAYSRKVRLTGGRRIAALFVLSGNNSANCSPGDPVRRAVLYAFDATSGRQLWTRSTSGPSRCTTSGPAVDPSGRWVFAAGLDGRVHRYSTGTGRESVGGGWPSPVTLMPGDEKISADLRITGRHLYATTSGFIGDAGHYEGHLVTIDTTTGKGTVFNSLCSPIRALLTATPGAATYCASIQAGMFGRGQGVTDPRNGDVYVVTGNGPWNGKTNWGDSILKLDPAGRRLLDAFTPTNQAQLNSEDLDLGSTAPAILPPVRSGGRTYNLLVQGGKGPACSSCGGVVLRLLNRDNLSGKGGPGNLGGDLADTAAPGNCMVLTAPRVWTPSRGPAIVIYANGCGIAGYSVRVRGAGRFTLARVWSQGTGGTTPALSHGVLYVARDGAVAAYSAASGRLLGEGGSIGTIHWEYPRVVGNRLYITDGSGTLTAFAIKRR